jgi:hypothetical protein
MVESGHRIEFSMKVLRELFQLFKVRLRPGRTSHKSEPAPELAALSGGIVSCCDSPRIRFQQQRRR